MYSSRPNLPAASESHFGDLATERITSYSHVSRSAPGIAGKIYTLVSETQRPMPDFVPTDSALHQLSENGVIEPHRHAHRTEVITPVLGRFLIELVDVDAGVRRSFVVSAHPPQSVMIGAGVWHTIKADSLGGTLLVLADRPESSGTEFADSLPELVAATNASGGGVMQRSPASIRKLDALSEAELDQVEEIELASFPRPWERSDFVEQLERTKVDLMVAEIGGSIVGYCFFDSGDQELLSIAVHPNLRRHLIGTALLGEIRARYGRFSAFVSEENVPAQLFMKKNGGVVSEPLASDLYDDPEFSDVQAMRFRFS